ncbi:MAG: DUF63 family protein [Nanoarchaeota archaeon]|nr:DUF63 family protein [Nanoarchaeota archaeon]
MAGFYEWFVEPILSNGWYNPINTLTYSVILIAAVFLVYKMLKKMNIHIDKYFFIAIFPFIFWGSSTRVLKDAATAGVLATPDLNAFYSAPFFVTPGSYIITFSLALVVLLASLLLQKLSHGKLPYWKVMAVIGIALCALNVYLLPIMAFEGFLIVAGLALFWTIVFFGLYYFFKTNTFRRFSDKIGLKQSSFKKLWSFQNTAILSGHFLDASATFIALSMFGYLEQHVVPRLLIGMMGPQAMFLLKFIIVLPTLWIIDKYADDGDFKNFLKIVVFILGFAPGMRDLLRLLIMV